MNIRIECFGKVREADIRIDGITVLSGPNGSGKSTISRMLMTWCALLRRMSDMLLAEREKSAREAIDEIIKKQGVPAVGFAFGRNSDERLKLLRPETWLNSETVEQYLLNAVPNYFFGERGCAESDARKIVEVREQIISAVDEIVSRDESYYMQSIVEMCFDNAFDREYISWGGTEKSLVKFEDDTQKTSIAEFEDGVIRCEGLSLKDAPLAFYLEPIHLLDLYAQRSRRHNRWALSSTNRYHANDVDWETFLGDEVDKTKWSVERKKKQEEIEAELDKIVEVIRGSLEKNENELKFMDKDVNHPISVMNVASGAKSIGVIVRGFRTGVMRPGCMLIIDEPESNLHPQWQVEFARFLVLLNAKFGVRLLVNTHSPYFLKALEVYSREEGVAPKAHYYFMESDDLGKTFIAKELKDGTNVVFKTFFDSLNELMGR